METSADISEDGVYRYRLTRWWAEGPLLVFCMLNPSTADAICDDPTIRRCINFAKRDNYSGIDVINLFAYRTSNPIDLTFGSRDKVGPRNDEVIAQVISENKIIVCGWGTRGNLSNAGQRVSHYMRNCGGILKCLELTASGHPRHPLYIKASQTLKPFSYSR